MSAAHDFLAGRGAVPIADVAAWLCRSRRFVYSLVARGDLDKFTPGRVTADSVARYYERFNEGGAADEVKRNTSSAVPVAAPQRDAAHRRGIDRARAVTGGAHVSGGAR